MQRMPILTLYRHSRAELKPIHTPHFLTDELLTGVWLHFALAPLILISQTFFIMCNFQLQDAAGRRER